MGMTTLPPNVSIGFGPAPIEQDPNAQDPTQLNAMDPNAQQMPPASGLPSVGMPGGKSGAMPPGVGIGFGPAPIDNQFAPTQDPMAAQSPVPSQNPPVSQPMQQAPGQQQPFTQGTGQLPPGFGALSPIDRSQIGIGQIGMFSPPANTAARNPLAPNAPQGMFGNQGRAPVGGMQGIAMPGRTPAPGPRMNDLSYGAMQGRQAVVPTTNRQMTPLQQNRFAPPNAPGVRTGITRPRVR